MVVWLFGWFGSLVVCMVWFEEIDFDYYYYYYYYYDCCCYYCYYYYYYYYYY